METLDRETAANPLLIRAASCSALRGVTRGSREHISCTSAATSDSGRRSSRSTHLDSVRPPCSYSRMIPAGRVITLHACSWLEHKACSVSAASLPGPPSPPPARPRLTWWIVAQQKPLQLHHVGKQMTSSLAGQRFLPQLRRLPLV